jgi:hypothetical protein
MQTNARITINFLVGSFRSKCRALAAAESAPDRGGAANTALAPFRLLLIRTKICVPKSNQPQ